MLSCLLILDNFVLFLFDLAGNQAHANFTLKCFKWVTILLLPKVFSAVFQIIQLFSKAWAAWHFKVIMRVRVYVCPCTQLLLQIWWIRAQRCGTPHSGSRRVPPALRGASLMASCTRGATTRGEEPTRQPRPSCFDVTGGLWGSQQCYRNWRRIMNIRT